MSDPFAAEGDVARLVAWELLWNEMVGDETLVSTISSFSNRLAMLIGDLVKDARIPLANTMTVDGVRRAHAALGSEDDYLLVHIDGDLHWFPKVEKLKTVLDTDIVMPPAVGRAAFVEQPASIVRGYKITLTGKAVPNDNHQTYWQVSP